MCARAGAIDSRCQCTRRVCRRSRRPVTKITHRRILRWTSATSLACWIGKCDTPRTGCLCRKRWALLQASRIESFGCSLGKDLVKITTCGLASTLVIAGFSLTRFELSPSPSSCVQTGSKLRDEIEFSEEPQAPGFQGLHEPLLVRCHNTSAPFAVPSVSSLLTNSTERMRSLPVSCFWTGSRNPMRHLYLTDLQA